MSREKQNMELQNDECNQYSVLMSLYKKEKPEYLKLALESMINQSIKPDEIVLVEDGPLTKELYDVIDEYKEYLYIVKNDENLGLGVSLKKGLKRCKNELVARMDTDDIAKLYRCEKQINYLKEHPECSIVGGQIEEFIVEESNIIGKRIVPCSDKELKEYIKTGDVIEVDQKFYYSYKEIQEALRESREMEFWIYERINFSEHMTSQDEDEISEGLLQTALEEIHLKSRMAQLMVSIA